MKQHSFYAIVKITIALLFLCSAVNAQSPSWQWAKNSSGGMEYNQASAADHNGNIYVTGIYQSASLTFDGPTINNTYPGSRDCFVAKYNSSGQIIWVKNIGGTAEQQILGIWADESGNLFITGDFSSPTLTIDGITVNNSETTGNQDIFIAKIDSDGTAMWVKSFGGGLYDYGYTVVGDAEGNIYLGGIFFSASINVGGITVYNTEVDDDHDVFFAKLDASGNTLWAKGAGGSSYDAIEAMTVDASGNLYLAGYFYSPTIAFGDAVLNNTNNYGDSYLVKYNALGELIWAKSVGGTNYDNIRAVKTDDAGNVFIAGHFESPTMTLGALSLTNVGTGNADGFLAKYSSDGTVLWARRAGGLNYDFVTDLVLDSLGNPCVTGSFNSATITFGNLSPLPSAGSYDLFVAKYTKDGVALWAKKNGGSSSDFGYTAATDGNDNLFVTGLVNSAEVNFDSNSITSSGTTVYVAKMNIGTLATASFEKNQIRIFPNPVSQTLYFESDTITPNRTYTVSDVNGRLLMSGISTTSSLDVSVLQNGIYFIGLDDHSTIKFIKE